MNNPNAKKLKDAGFPQQNGEYHQNWYKGEYITCPTLEEVIMELKDDIKLIDMFNQFKETRHFLIAMADKEILGHSKFTILLRDWKYLGEALVELYIIKSQMK